MPNVLGFDFGAKRIGVAWASNAMTKPVILPSIAARDGIPDWELIRRLVQDWQTQAFVVGMPYNMDGTVGEMAYRARKFANRLAHRFQLPSYIVDERLSTYEAKQQTCSHDITSHWQRQEIDGIAAQLILQTWFAETTHLSASQPFEDV